MLEGIFNTTLVFLVIGVLIVLILSFAAMVIFDWFEARLRWRSRFLHDAIRQMLGDDELTASLYAHTLIADLYQIGWKPGRKQHLPDYIPADKFALALFDTLLQQKFIMPQVAALAEEVGRQLSTLSDKKKRNVAQEEWSDLLTEAESTAASRLSEAAINSLIGKIQAFGDKYPDTKPIIERQLTDVSGFYQDLLSEEQHADPNEVFETDPLIRRFELGLQTLGSINTKLKMTLSTLLRKSRATSSTGDTVGQNLLTYMKDWFNDTMDALTSYYRDRTWRTYFLIGIAMAFILNVDSGKIITSLWYQATYPQREGTIAQTIDYLDKNPVPGVDLDTLIYNELQTTLDNLKFPLGWQFEQFNTDGKACVLVPVDGSQAWGILGRDDQGTLVCKRLASLPADLLGWLGKLAGLVATGAFIPVGGSYLHEVMKKLVDIRRIETGPVS